MTHLSQLSAIAVRTPCMHVRSGGMDHCVTAGAGSGGGSAGNDAGSPRLARPCSKRPSGHGLLFRRSNASTVHII
jgi:hypothetical protein